MDPYKERRLALLRSLYERGDGVLEWAAEAIGRETGGPVFDFDKRELIKDGAMVRRTEIPQGIVGDEFYEVTSAGEKMLQDAGYLA
jgi:hypothetical protein